MSRRKLPPDWGIDALAAEAKRRGVDYGTLKAETSLYERDQIREEYRKHYGEKPGKTLQKGRDPQKVDLAREVQKYERDLEEH